MSTFQLSSCYKSSAELVSELLQRPVLLTNFKQGSKNDELKANQKKKVTQSDIQKPSDQLKSVVLVKSIGQNQRKVGRDECRNPQVQNGGRQMPKDEICEDKTLKSYPVTAGDSDQSMGSASDSSSYQSSEGGYSINDIFLRESLRFCFQVMR